MDRPPTRLAYDAVIPRELTTERLLLRQWRDEDADALYEIYTQPEYLETMPPLDLEGTRAQVARFQQRWADDGYCTWVACDRETGVLIGRIGVFCHHDWPLSTARSPRWAGCCTATGGAAASRPRAGRRASTPGASTCRTSPACTRSRCRATAAHAP